MWLFFAWRRGGRALADILLPWALIAAAKVRCARVRPAAGALLLPYRAWVSFAAVLNDAVWRMNPDALG